MDTLETRTGLPDALRVLAEQYPRDLWESHENFDGLTRFWMDRHRMFRDLLDRQTALTADHLDGRLDPQRFAANTARLMGMFLNQLHGHHQIEDAHYFPVLQAHDARLARGFEILDADHHMLDGQIHGLADRTNAALRAVQAGGATRDAAGALHGDLGRFETFLDRHLTDEEDLVIPVILHYAARL